MPSWIGQLPQRRGSGKEAAGGDAAAAAAAADGLAMKDPPAAATPRTSWLASPRALLASPRSILSTPRSLLSTPRSLLSSQQERWAAAREEKNRLYAELGPGLSREELGRLSRGQLRYRLRELGAARSEGEGLAHGRLVDTVLLWNALARLQEDNAEEQVAAMHFLRDGGLSADLLVKALRVAGAPPEKLKGLGRREAAEMLHGILRRYTSRQEAFRRIARLELGLLQDCFQIWLSARFAAEAGESPEEASDVDSSHLDQPSRPPLASALPHDALSIAGSGLGGRAVFGEPGGISPIAEHPCEGEPLDADSAGGAEAGGVDCRFGPDRSSGAPWPPAEALPQDGRGDRDAKFEALDMDLAACLRDAPPERGGRGPPAPGPSARDAKFEALDADLTQCVADDGGGRPRPTAAGLPAAAAPPPAVGSEPPRPSAWRASGPSGGAREDVKAVGEMSRM